MKSKALTLLTAVLLFAALAFTGRLVAQAQQQLQAKHHHYKLIDLGTFGGPTSGVNGEPTENFINMAGVLVGGADTGTLTPVPGGFNPIGRTDFFISHAFVWNGESLKDLGTLPGGDFSFAAAINQRGQIAGVSENGQIDPAFGNPQFHAVLWEHGTIRDLGTLGGMSSFAISINNQGQVIGVALNDVPDSLSILGSGDGTTSTQTRGFLWQNGKMHDLGTLGGPDTFAIFLNQRGQVAGMSYTSDIPDPTTGFPPMDPFLWENGKIKDLGNFGGTNPLGLFSGFISGLNDSGQVTGTMTLSGDQTAHAFLWNGEKLSDLGTLGGSFATSYGLNNVGEIVGLSGLPGDNVFHAFLWRNEVMTDLGTVDGDACSTAQNVNSIGQVVGSSQASDGMGGCVNPFTHAFLWENAGPSVDLNALIPANSPLQLTDAALINESGEIIGGGNPPGCTNDDSCNHAYVLIPCDENHQNIAGCDYSLVDAAAVPAHLEPSQNIQRSTPPSAVKLSPAEMMTRFRSFGAGSNRRYGIPQTSQKTALSGAATISAPSAALSPTSVTFSTEAIGITSAAKTVTLKNAGTTSLTITAIAIAGTNAGDFAQTHTCGSSLAVGASCNISVTFKPTANGTRAAALRVTDNAAGSPQQVTLSGIGTTAKLSPVSLSFLTQAIGTTSAAKNVTLTNVGATALTITSIAIAGTNAADFAQIHTCGSSLAVGASCDISVTFKPTASGTRAAALRVTDNAAGSPQQVTLSGIGTTAKLSPVSLSFSTQAIGTTSTAKNVTFTNVGATTLTITSIAVTGTNAGDFPQTHTCGIHWPRARPAASV